MKRTHHLRIASWAVLSLALLCGSQALRLHAAAPRHPQAGVSLEFIGQGLVVSPAEVYQYGYFRGEGIANPLTAANLTGAASVGERRAVPLEPSGSPRMPDDSSRNHTAQAAN